MKTKEWDKDIDKSIKHRTIAGLFADQTTGIQYTRLVATRDLREALTTLRRLGESRENLKAGVDVVCNKIKKED